MFKNDNLTCTLQICIRFWSGLEKLVKTGLHARETFQNKTCTAFILHKLEDPRTITMGYF